MPYITSIQRLGRKEGRQEGQQVGTTALVLILLRKQLGPLSPSLRQSVKDLSLLQLRHLGEALLDFESVEDLKAWLAKRKRKAKPLS